MASRRRNQVSGALAWVLAAAGLLALAACGRNEPARSDGDAGSGADGGPPRIVVTIPPLRWPVDQLAPAGSEIDLIVPPGASAHGYELTPGLAAAIARADLVVMVGMGMEPRVEAALAAHPNPRRKVVRFEDIVGADAITAGEDHDHDHSHDHGHIHGADPHAWLDPVLMARFVERVAEAMPADDERPGLAAKRAAELQARCAAIDTAYRSALERVASKSIVAQHNAFAYIAERYGLTVAAVIQGADGGHGAEPTPGEVAEAARAIRESGVGAIFVEPQMNDAPARRIAEAASVAVFTLDPLGDGDWPELMRRNLESLVEGLGG